MKMKELVLTLALAVSLVPAAARAQVSVSINLGLPAAPVMAEVQPGVQVVEGSNDEVFRHKGWYWCRRGNTWYRARTPQTQFVPVETRRVPAALVQSPEGRYRNWHHADMKGPRGEARGHEKHEAREDRGEARGHHHDDR
jgi:hypothetical protein